MDSRNTVVVISPHCGKEMHDWYHRASSLVLAAEDCY